ncbi:hypothetical protein, partial [Pantoea conspicua]|uniref:hypothetical protein n=1 Tax=Pantoea conspicua TaxID=472705 RepID=UPI001ABF357C
DLFNKAMSPTEYKTSIINGSDVSGLSVAIHISSICYTFDGIAECVFDFVVVWRAKSSYDEYCMDKQKYRSVLLMKADRLTNL